MSQPMLVSLSDSELLDALDIALHHYKVAVLSGCNTCQKSRAAELIQLAAEGYARLSLRDTASRRYGTGGSCGIPQVLDCRHGNQRPATS
jgi:hypothetical protein